MADRGGDTNDRGTGDERLHPSLGVGTFPQFAAERREVAAFGKDDVHRPADDWHEASKRPHEGPDWTVHELALVRVRPRVAFVLTRLGAAVVVIAVMHVVAPLPRPIRHQDRGVCYMAYDVVEPLVLRERPVAAVVAHHKEAPHEEPVSQPVRHGDGHLRRKREPTPRFALDEAVKGPHGAEHQSQIPRQVRHACRQALVEAVRRDGLAEIAGTRQILRMRNTRVAGPRLAGSGGGGCSGLATVAHGGPRWQLECRACFVRPRRDGRGVAPRC
mmetsp:Transcript_13586/g.34960  ORF Transcript_13586/g.34960 Transcript_13586/m.34960 type:complete len:273 (-) Transcript_13586:84-902(-)